MKNPPKLIAVFAVALAASSANAATTLLSENFESPAITSDVNLDDFPNHLAGWTWNTNGSDQQVLHEYRDNDVPDGGSDTSRSLQFVYTERFGSKDTSHNWSSTDVFSVNMNATESNWSNGSERYVRMRIRETGGDIVYQADWHLPQYDAANNKGDDWSAAQTHTFNFSAADFDGSVYGTTVGTEGSALTFEIGSTRYDLVDGSVYSGSNRGLKVDNIVFSAVPEPSSTALLGLGGLALILRRRR